MTSSAHIAGDAAAAPTIPASAVEAARYALLRRLAPSMRHHLVVNLQPIGMIYEVMERRLRGAAPDLHEVQESAQKINGFARAAINSCLDVVTWLAPEDNARVAPLEGVRECLSLLATSLTFRGYTIRDEVTEAAGLVSRPAMRTVLTAALLQITDENKAPASVVLTSSADANAFVIEFALRPGEGETGFAPKASYRALAWSDLQALAQAEGVQCTREGRQQLRIAIPLAAPA